MIYIRELFLISIFITPLRGSFCGESAIPFSFEALPDGQPILGCARPTCFGWNADGKPFSQNAQFYSVNKIADGFMRKSFDMPRERSDDGARGSFMPQIAECEPAFESDSCPRTHQWVGGIAPISKDSKASLSLQCCSYNILKYSIDRGVATIHPGEIVVGGEVLNDGRQYAFDYIADIQKVKSDDDSAVYDVTVRRFPCLPMPDEQSISVDNSVIDEMERRFYLPGKISTIKHNRGNAIAFQAPIQTIPAAIPQQIGVQETIEQVVQQPVRPVQTQLVQQFQVQRFQAIPVQQLPPPPPPPPPPAPVAVRGGGFAFCFSSDMNVETSNGKMKRMDELKVDDWILSARNADTEYIRVKSWMHRLPQQEAIFLRINLEDGNSIKLTRKHFIYKTICSGNGEFIQHIKGDAVWAENVHIGDCLYSLNKANKRFIEMKVISIEEVNETGIFAPLTENGKLLVNGVLASCYTNIESHRLQRYYFQVMETWASVARRFFGHSIAKMLFGSLENSEKDIPFGVNVALEMLELVLPKNIRLL